MKSVIYGLFNKRTGLCVYVGSTTRWKIRRQTHIGTARANHRPIPEFRILKIVTKQKSWEEERKQIKLFRELKHPIRNKLSRRSGGVRLIRSMLVAGKSVWIGLRAKPLVKELARWNNWTIECVDKGDRCRVVRLRD